MRFAVPTSWLLVCALILISPGLAAQEEGPPLLDFQKMQALKGRLAGLLWEVEVLPKPTHPNMVPESVPKMIGQAVPVEIPGRGVLLLVSGDLIRDWSRIDARASGGRRCSVEDVRLIEELGVGLMRCAEPLKDTKPVPLAPDEIGVEGALAFSIDDPASPQPSMYHGFLAEAAEPPLIEFHYTHLGGGWSYPLLNHRGELVALTLRRLRGPRDTLALAVTCRQLREGFRARRRDPEGPTRLRDTTRRPFHYE